MPNSDPRDGFIYLTIILVTYCKKGQLFVAKYQSLEKVKNSTLNNEQMVISQKCIYKNDFINNSTRKLICLVKLVKFHFTHRQDSRCPWARLLAQHVKKANFMPSFPDTFRLAPSPPELKTIWPIIEHPNNVTYILI